MAGHDVIVVGASAGGVEALLQLVRLLPPGLPAAVFVVCHFPIDARSALPEILSREGPLLARHARDAEPIYPAHIYVAPPDHHLEVQHGTVRLERGPRENGCRPSIEPLFRSAAHAYGPRVIAVLLSGGSHDGIAGLLAVRAAGGLAVLQDPADALVPTLPRSAGQVAGADHVVPARELGPLLARLVQQSPPLPAGLPPAGAVERIVRMVERDMKAQADNGLRDRVSLFTCPECGGCMWQTDEQAPVRFRCHVGHAYAAEALLHEQGANLEAALWTAVRTFRERSILARQLAGRDRQSGHTELAQRFEEEARVAEQSGALIQQYLLEGTRGTDPGQQSTGPPPHRKMKNKPDE